MRGVIEGWAWWQIAHLKLIGLVRRRDWASTCRVAAAMELGPRIEDERPRLTSEAVLSGLRALSASMRQIW